VDFWTSGTDKGCKRQYKWCSKNEEMNVGEINWKSGEPNSASGDCVFVKFSNASADASTYAVADCSEVKNFICEVIYYIPPMHFVS
jgi:hypothetical protein